MSNKHFSNLYDILFVRVIYAVTFIDLEVIRNHRTIRFLEFGNINKFSNFDEHIVLGGKQTSKIHLVGSLFINL